MKVGLWGARADRRGLAIQTGEFARHMQPDRVMGFDLTVEDRSPYPCDWRDYDGLDLTVAQPTKLSRDAAVRWLDGLDVVFAAETFYLDEVPTWADELGVATVCQVNPEFYRWGTDTELPRPTLTVAPTSWRLDRMPGVELLPFPVDRQRCRYRKRPLDTPVTFLHVAGHPAMYDRNGTSSLLQALQHMREPSRLIIRSQAGLSRRLHRRTHDTVDIDVRVEDVPDYWRLYDGADVLVLPRRYGGQSLPMNEAMSCGMPVVTTNVAPQNGWLPPATLVPARVRRRLGTQAGTVDVHHADPVGLARTMDRLAADPGLVSTLSEVSDRRAETISWEAMEPVYRDTLARAADMLSVRSDR